MPQPLQRWSYIPANPKKKKKKKPLTPTPTEPLSLKPTISTVVKIHTSKETHQPSLIGITIGDIGAPIQTHRSHVDPSDFTVKEAMGSWVWREQRVDEKKRRKRDPSEPRRPIHGVLGLKRAKSWWEREKEEREKNRNNERGERNSRLKMRRED